MAKKANKNKKYDRSKYLVEVLQEKRFRCDKWEIDADRLYIRTERLGAGAFATVYKGTYKGRLPILDIAHGPKV